MTDSYNDVMIRGSFIIILPSQSVHFMYSTFNIFFVHPLGFLF